MKFSERWLRTMVDPALDTAGLCDRLTMAGLEVESAAIARQAGLSERDTTAGLAQLLPEIIDRATPQGQVPDNDQLAGTLQDLMRRLGA